MEHSAEYEHARKRAAAKYGFYVHCAVYVAVNLMLLAINLITSPGALWFVWPLMGWGVAIVLHGTSVFLMPDGNTIIDTMTEREMDRTGAGRRRTDP